MWRLVGLVFVIACGSTPRGNPADSKPPPTRPFAPSALDKPAFEATPAELLAIAKAQPADEWVILHDEHHADFDERGTLVESQRTVFRLGVTDVFARRHGYDASTTARPTVRVRVIKANGSARELPATAFANEALYPDEDAPAHDVAYELTDVASGDIVEELVTRTIKPRVGRDNLARHVIGWVDARVLQTRSVYSAPTSLDPAHLAFLPKGARVEETEANGRRTWTWELGPLEVVPDEEVNQPQEWPGGLQIAFATGASWRELAAAYLPIVDRALAQPLTVPAGVPRGRTRETAIAIARWLVAHVESSHLDTDMGGLAVRTPTQTLAQGGTSLDRAVLFVALLRAAGIPADLALADRTGGVTTIDSVPSLLALDHPLVRARPDGKDQWFCLEIDALAMGRLSQDDRGRSALVIAADTQALTRTPDATATEHTSRQVRTYTLADDGVGSVAEVLDETGDLALIRLLSEQNDSDQQRAELMAQYVAGHYGGTIAKQALVPQPDPAAAHLELAITGADRVVTAVSGFEYQFNPLDLIFDLPAQLRDETEPARRAPFYWALPFTNAIEYRFIMPAGFAAPPLPADHTLPLGGGATYTERWRVDGRTVVASLQVVTGTGSITADEANQLRDSLIELLANPINLRLVPEAYELTAVKKHREALASLESVVRAHPKVLIHRQRLAYGLTGYTLGAEARRVARDAVKLAATDPDAHVTLGGILEYDRFGRQHGAGWDRAGAIAAYARARKLDPKHLVAAKEHARVLLLGDNGIELESGAQPAEAVEPLQAAYALDSDPATGERYAFALIHARRFQDALTALAAMGDSVEVQGMRIAALAMSASAADVQKAVDAAEQDRDAILEVATRFLIRLREWSVARTVAARNPQGAGARVVGALPTLARVPPLPTKSKDPRDAAKRAFERGLTGTGDTSFAWDSKTADELSAAESRDPMVGQLLGYFGTTDVVRDLVLALTTTNSVGEPGGPWRVEMAVRSAKLQFFVALDRGQAKVVGTGYAARGLGRHILRLVKAGELDDAGQLTEWYAATTSFESLRAITTGLARTKENLELAGMILAGDLAGGKPALERCRDDARFTTEARAACSTLLQSAAATRVRELAHRGKLAEAEALLATVTEPDTALVARMELLAAKQDLAGAITAGEALLAIAPTQYIQNQLAWLIYLKGGDFVRALELANAAVGADPAKTPRHVLNTRAAILVEMDRYDLAHEDLTQAHINGRRRDERGDTFVYARIAERLGYAATAKALYAEVAKGPNKDPLSVDMLAKQRL